MNVKTKGSDWQLQVDFAAVTETAAVLSSYPQLSK